MALPEAHVPEIAQIIQLSVAPVFLLAGVGAIVNAMSGRLSRAIDRARALEAELEAADPRRAERVHDELARLSKRARLIGLGIALSVMCALFVTLLLIAAFLAAFLATDMSYVLAAIFIAALASFSGALVVFLREVLIATANLRIGPH
jgi:MFS family permease